MSGPKPTDYFPNDKATNEWLSSQKRGTVDSYRSAMRYFQEFVGMTGDEILQSRKEDMEKKAHIWEQKVLAFKQWMIEEKKLAVNTSSTKANAVRGFFAYYYMKLEYRRSDRMKLRERKRLTEDYRFSREDLKRMAEVADLDERYVLVVGKSFGLRAGDFLRLRRGDLAPYLDREPPIGIGEIGTQKESVMAYPFIDSDALPIIKAKIEQMNRQGRTDPALKILRYKQGRQLSRILRRLAERAGIDVGTRIFRFHCLRKFLIDRLSDVMSESKWKQIVGKKISEGAYVSTDNLRKDYARAMTETCFSEMTDRTSLKEEILKEMLKNQAKALGATDEQMTRLFATADAKVLREFQKSLLKGRLRFPKAGVIEVDNDNQCPNGENCQKVVNEEELEGYLSKGWRVSVALPSGKVVISNE